MPLAIQPLTAECAEAVAAFNRRLAAAGIADRQRLGNRLPESPIFPWPSLTGGDTPYHELFVARENGFVRGGYVLKQQQFLVAGKVQRLAQYRLPISEGFVDAAFAGVGVQLLLDAMRRQPLLYTIGIGGSDEPMAKILQAAKWRVTQTPFYFRIIKPNAFLRNIRYLRSSAWRRVAMDLMAISGIGGIGVQFVQHRRTKAARRPLPECSFSLEATHGAWADDIWAACQSHYSLAAVRDSKNLQVLYPEGDYRFIRLKVSDASGVVGWCVLLNPRMDDHSYFGNMRVGTIVDTLALPGKELTIIGAAMKFLSTHGAELIVGNFSHEAWRDAVQAAGLMSGPSNYLIAIAPKLAALLEPAAETSERWHWTRGDGSGPENLFGAKFALFES